MRAIVGTAGHIDHGKTALVRALTGIETDRLPQERQRGISIELGFAYLDLPGGDRAGIVDVPGHERFIRQMLAGAQGFDLLLLVVAADDGVMPQTEEHFEICHLLGVKDALIAITKTDLADAGRIADVRDEIEILVAGTEFAGAPVFEVSAANGHGVAELREALVAALLRSERPQGEGPFRLPIDRAFVLKGHGLVITGTATGGTVKVGDELTVVPGGRTVRVREIQVHERPVEQASAGQRVALNLAGIDREEARRGHCLVASGVRSETTRLDAAIEIRPSAGRPVRSHQRVRIYLGTSDRSGRLLWLGDSSSVAPRGRGYAQISIAEPIVAFSGDRFVLRDETASRTLGGGTVLLARARRHRGDREEVARRLERLATGNEDERVVAFLDGAEGLGLAPAEVAVELGLSPEAILSLARSSKDIEGIPPGDPVLLVSSERLRRCRQELVLAVRQYHQANPSSPGIELERLRDSLSFSLDARQLRIVVESLIGDRSLIRNAGRVAFPDHRASVRSQDEALAVKIFDLVREGGMTPPSLKQIEEQAKVPLKKVAEIVAVLVQRGDLVKVSPELVFSADVLEKIEHRLRRALSDGGSITAAAFRDLIGASRKYSIPLLDYFDRRGVTVRQGDYRRLRSDGSTENG